MCWEVKKALTFFSGSGSYPKYYYVNTPEAESPSLVEKSKVVARVEESFYTKIVNFFDRFMNYWSPDQSDSNKIHSVSENQILERTDDQPDAGSGSTIGQFV